jgi:HAD superfamily hydrolase (TIGR01509 family)
MVDPPAGSANQNMATQRSVDAELGAVIFDMDGVLIDSEPIATRLRCEMLAGLGVDLSPEDVEALKGATSDQYWTYLRSRYGLPESNEHYRSAYDLQREIDAYTPELAAPGCIILIRSLGQGGIALGLATSACRRRTEAVLRLLELDAVFGCTVCGEEISEGKPHPMVFELAARRLGVEPHRCLVFEDSERGIQAAGAAGMVVVRYTGFSAASTPADAVVNDFREVSVADLKNLWQACRH